MVSVDLDPDMAGVQSVLTVAPGDSFQVDVVISGVTNLAGFEFDLDFDSTVFEAVSVVSGGFLPTTLLPPIVIEDNISAPDVNFAEAALSFLVSPLLPGASGAGVLATIGFDVLPGAPQISSLLALSDVLLSQPTGTPVQGFNPTNGLRDATVTVVADSTVPVPATGLLLALGLAGLLASRRRHGAAVSRGRCRALTLHPTNKNRADL
jgi:hypothetical protein